MARIPLTGGYSLMSEGEHVLMITEADYKEDFGKIKLTMATADGKKHFENYTLFNKDGEPNDGACGAFSGLAKAALADPDAEDIDPNDLKGLFVKGTISYREYEGNDGKMKKTTQKAPGTWWEEVTPEEIASYQIAQKNKEAKAAPAPAPAPAAKKPAGLDLNALLGR